MAVTYEELIAKSRELHAKGDMEGSKRVAEIALKIRPRPEPQTGVVDQLGSGTNEGIAAFAGMPVDLMTGALNMALPESMEIKDPFGGSGTFKRALDPLISDVPPQSMGQRFARRIGQEVGYGVPASMVGARLPGIGPSAQQSMPAYLGASAAGDVGAGVAGQTATEIAPDNALAQIVATLAGGVVGSGGASMMMPSRAPTPSLEDVKARASSAWDDVAASDAKLSDQAVADLDAAVRGSLPKSQLGPKAYPNAFGLADEVPNLKNPTVSEVEDMRRIVGDAVAGNPNESRVGVGMKKAIADYLSGVKSGDFVSGDGTEVAGDLSRARDLTSRVKRAEAVINKEMRGESRAATSGTGGNEVNAQRQNIRSLFDVERDPTLSAKRKGFTPEEMKAMERVVFGTGGSNAARAIGRMAPTSGALPQMLTGWGGAAGLSAGLATGNPLMMAPAAIGAIGFGGKAAAESMTKGQIQDLIAIILSGQLPKKSAAKSASQAAIIEQLLSNSAGGVQN